jgi:hypothetical protein
MNSSIWTIQKKLKQLKSILSSMTQEEYFYELEHWLGRAEIIRTLQSDIGILYLDYILPVPVSSDFEALRSLRVSYIKKCFQEAADELVPLAKGDDELRKVLNAYGVEA